MLKSQRMESPVESEDQHANKKESGGLTLCRVAGLWGMGKVSPVKGRKKSCVTVGWGDRRKRCRTRVRPLGSHIPNAVGLRGGDARRLIHSS